MSRRSPAVLGFTIALMLGSGGHLLAETRIGNGVPNADITIASVLTMAKDAAEAVSNERQRVFLRRRVALFMRNSGHEAAFERYVADATNAADALDEQSPSVRFRREGEARNRKIFADAKRTFLDGDSPGARQLLRNCEWIPHGVSCMGKEPWTDGYFVNWDLEAGNLADAVQRLRTTDWKSDGFQASVAQRVAAALGAAWGRSQGVDLLLDARMAPSLPKYEFAEAIWKLGEVETGKNLQRQAVAAALNAAEQDVTRALPIDLVSVQLAMGDRDGAIEALRRLLRFAGPLEYDLPPPRPPGVRAEKWDQRAKLKPAAGRWTQARARLVETLAWAGLDADALALLDEVPVDHALVLRGIVRGQAMRGDFESALKTLELIRTATLRVAYAWDRPSPDAIEPAGANSYRLRDAPLGLLDEDKRDWSFFVGASSIATSAARYDDEAVFRRACALNKEINWSPSIRNACPARLLGNLARAGRVQAAVEIALAAPDAPTRVAGLGHVALGMAGVPDPLDFDPLRRWR